MKYGSSIFVIAIGLIVALAINVDVQGVDIQLIGWILTILGGLGLLITVVWDISAASRGNQAKPTQK